MVDVGEYCRQVEDFLTRVNGGHLVRIVGPAFDLVRGWAETGVPLSVVFRGIEHKVDRQRAAHAGDERSARPLRVEFCSTDVREVYEGWRRAVGLPVAKAPDVADEAANAAASEPADRDAPADRRRPSLSKHLDRAIDRLGRAAGRLDLAEPFRDALGVLLNDLALSRVAVKDARGPARDDVVRRLAELDRRLMEAARAAAPADVRAALAHEAERDLAPFRSRLPAGAWRQALDATVDRLLRDRFGLPTLEP